MVYCYNPPRYNFFDLFNAVTITVSSVDGPSPSVYGASRDDLHGIIDSWIKAKVGGSSNDPNMDVSERALERTEYFATPLDLLSECPPIWDSKSTDCIKVFSPFGISCTAVTARKRADRDKEMKFRVKATSGFEKGLPVLLLIGACILATAKYLAKSKVVWYSSGISISIFAGVVILVVVLCRKVRVPGTSGTSFTVVTALGYGAVWMRYVASTMRAVVAKYWQLLAVYCAIFGVLGFIHIARIRRNETRKHDFRILVLWSLRLLGLFMLCRGTRSSLVSCLTTAALSIYYIATHFSLGKSSNTAKGSAPPPYRGKEPRGAPPPYRENESARRRR